MVYSESTLKVEKSSNQSKPSFNRHFGKVIRHSADCWFTRHNRGPSFTSVYNEIATAIFHSVPHMLACSNRTGKTISVNYLFWLPFESTRTETVVQGICWDRHRATRPKINYVLYLLKTYIYFMSYICI